MTLSEGLGLRKVGALASDKGGLRGSSEIERAPFRKLMPIDDDTSSEHSDWLVEGRARNQRSTVTLYKLIEESKASIERNIAYERLARDLSAIAFSLWPSPIISQTLSSGFEGSLPSG